MNKSDCESLGGEWINEYRKKDGTMVRSYCRQPGDSATNTHGDEAEKKKEFEVNQQVILNKLLESIQTLDFDDAQTTLDVLIYSIEHKGEYKPELYQAYKNSSPKFKKTLQTFLNNDAVYNFSCLSPGRWGDLDEDGEEASDEYRVAVQKFVKK